MIKHSRLFALIILEFIFLAVMIAGMSGEASELRFLPADFYDNIQGRDYIYIF